MKNKGIINQLKVIALSTVMVVTTGVIPSEVNSVQAAKVSKPTYQMSYLGDYHCMHYNNKATGEQFSPRVLKKTTTLSVYPRTKSLNDYNESYDVIIKQLPDKITKIKLSKKSVVSLKKMKASKYKSFKNYKGVKGLMVLRAKKAGTTTVTIKGRKNGKKRTYKFKIRVKKYTNPVKSLKINKKSLTKKETSKREFGGIKLVVRLGKTKKVKVTLRVKKGYTCKELEYYSYKPFSDKLGILDYESTMKNKKYIKRVIPTSYVKACYKANYLTADRKWATPEKVWIGIEKKSMKNAAWGEQTYFMQYVYIK